MCFLPVGDVSLSNSIICLVSRTTPSGFVAFKIPTRSTIVRLVRGSIGRDRGTGVVAPDDRVVRAFKPK